MFIIKERVDRCSPDLIAMFKEVEPATLGHVLHQGFMDYTLRCLVKGAKVVGPAVTVKTAGADSTVVHKTMEIAQKGDVVVVDRCGDMRHACWGGVVTLAASLRGIAAVHRRAAGPPSRGPRQRPGSLCRPRLRWRCGQRTTGPRCGW